MTLSRPPPIIRTTYTYYGKNLESKENNDEKEI